MPFLPQLQSFCRVEFAASFDQVGNFRDIAVTFPTKITQKSHKLLWEKSHVKTDLKIFFWELLCKTVLGDGALIFHQCVLLSDPGVGACLGQVFWFSTPAPCGVRVFSGYSLFNSLDKTNVSIDLPWLAVSTIRRILNRALPSKVFNLMSDDLFFSVLIGQNYRRICLQIQRPSSRAGNIDSSSTVSGTISDMSHTRDLPGRLYFRPGTVQLIRESLWRIVASNWLKLANSFSPAKLEDELKKWSSHSLDNLSSCLIRAPKRFQVPSTRFEHLKFFLCTYETIA